MIRRLLIGLAVVAVAAAAVVTSGGSGGEEPPRFWIEFDNAFGLVEGGDVRVAGVNAGEVRTLDLDQRSKKALVEVEITAEGFGSLREDVFCESRPQSPIGEYFIDCIAGTSPKRLRPGSRIPVRQTGSTIPPDLSTNVMRRPYRERVRIVLGELGAGLAGRPEDLNEAIRRAVPALRQTNRVLSILAQHRNVIRDLVGDAEVVIDELADNRRNVGRFVVEAGDTASAAAERRDDIARNFNRLPIFLEELRPTMAALGESAEEQTPVLEDLRASSGQLRRFFDNAADFSDATLPALRKLGDAALVGREAVTAARPQVAELRRYAEKTPELGQNLRIVLEDFDDRSRAVEPDPRSPGGQGYTGLEALLRYVFNQSMATNAFDQNGYMLRIALHTDKCGPYGDAESARDPNLQDCISWLGPSQPGVNQPDPTAEGRSAARERRSRTRARREDRGARRDRGEKDERGDGRSDAPSGRSEPEPPRSDLERLLDDIVRQGEGGLPAPQTTSPQTLLDFLLLP